MDFMGFGNWEGGFKGWADVYTRARVLGLGYY